MFHHIYIIFKIDKKRNHASTRFLFLCSDKIQKQIENLESEQAATVREKQELQKKLKTLGIIQQNFTALLDAPLFQESIEKSENVL